MLWLMEILLTSGSMFRSGGDEGSCANGIAADGGG